MCSVLRNFSKTLTLVLFEGKARVLNEMVDADAIIVGVLSGPQGGQALVEILLGEVNPSGRLPITGKYLVMKQFSCIFVKNIERSLLRLCC